MSSTVVAIPPATKVAGMRTSKVSAATKRKRSLASGAGTPAGIAESALNPHAEPVTETLQETSTKVSYGKKNASTYAPPPVKMPKHPMKLRNRNPIQQPASHSARK
eukprot:g12294.t1